MTTDLESVKETAIAAQEIAKTASNAIEASREMGGFVSKFISAPLEQCTGILEDKLRFMRWERRVRLMAKAEELMKQQALSGPDIPIPLKNAIPFLEHASLEENDTLQDMWAQLLVNGTHSQTGISLDRSFIEILSQLSVLEASILNEIYSLPFEEVRHSCVITSDLPDSVSVDDNESDENLAEPNHAVKMALSNLARLGCLKFGMTWGGGESFTRINLTLMGYEFIKACTEQ
ncbi:TPA: Abi-alpha family protein [Vibrio vulnificus]